MKKKKPYSRKDRRRRRRNENETRRIDNTEIGDKTTRNKTNKKISRQVKRERTTYMRRT